jgi:hypothetical protein
LCGRGCVGVTPNGVSSYAGPTSLELSSSREGGQAIPPVVQHVCPPTFTRGYHGRSLTDPLSHHVPLHLHSSSPIRLVSLGFYAVSFTHISSHHSRQQCFEQLPRPVRQRLSGRCRVHPSSFDFSHTYSTNQRRSIESSLFRPASPRVSHPHHALVSASGPSSESPSLPTARLS